MYTNFPGLTSRCDAATADRMAIVDIDRSAIEGLMAWLSSSLGAAGMVMNDWMGDGREGGDG